MPQVGRFELLGEVGDPRVLLEEMFAHAPVALQVYDVSGRSLLVNGAFVELFGAAPPPDYDVFKDEILERQGLSDLVRRAFAGETVRVPPHWYDPRELRHVRVKEGKRVAIEITLFPLRGPAGGVSHVVLCVKDVTSEFRLALSEARYRTQLEAAPEAVVTLDLETRRFVEANQRAVDLFGYPREELLTKNHLDVSPALQPDGRPSAEAAPDHLERVMRGDRPTFEWTHRDAQGREIPCEIRLVRLPSERENLCRGSIVDLRERKRLEQQLRETEAELRQSQKMEAIGRLAGGVAHDFNNLLSVIIGSSSLLLDELDPASELRSELDAIRLAGERAAELTRQLLAFARRQMLLPRVVALDAVVRDAESILRRLLGEDIQLVSRLLGETVRVRADPSQVHQIIMNLAVNARDAMPDGGKLEIFVCGTTLDDEALATRLELPPGRYALLRVRDTGVGMDAATQARAFEPFFTTKGPGQGSGLGLSTVFGIVKQSGGGISVESEPGHGTTFRIYLPEVLEPPPSSSERAGEPKAQADETLLVVEDQEEVRNVVREILTRQGYRVLEAGNGTEALLVSDRYVGELDLLLTDLVMPGMSGRELAERMRRRQPDLPVLFMSGFAEDSLGAASAAGSDIEFLQKPIVPRVLAERVRALLARSRR